MKKIHFYLGPMIVGSLMFVSPMNIGAQTNDQNANVLQSELVSNQGAQARTVANTTYPYSYEVIIKGRDVSTHPVVLKVDSQTKKINFKVNYEDSILYNEYPGELASVQLMDKNFNVKYSVGINGNQKLKDNQKIQQLKKTGMSFEYGDIIQLKHKDSQNRLTVSNGYKPVQLNNVTYFRMTGNGFERIEVNPTITANDVYVIQGDEAPNSLTGIQVIDPFTKEDITSRVTKTVGTMNTSVTGHFTYTYQVKTSDGVTHTFTRKLHVAPAYNNEITIKGINSYDFVKFKLNTQTKQIMAYQLRPEGMIHHVFTDEYASLTLFDKNMNQKDQVTLIGNQDMNNMGKLQEMKSSGMNFEYGDIIRVNHREAKGRLAISNLNGTLSQVNYFKVTENGFERIEVNPTITADDVYVIQGDEAPNALTGIQVIDPFTKADITSNVVLQRPIDTSNAGEYTLTYEVQLSNGVKHTFTRKLHVAPAYPNDIIIKSIQNEDALTLRFNTQTKKINLNKILNGMLNDSSDNYVTIKLFDEENTEKYSLELVGNQNLTENKLIQQLKASGLPFEYGDTIMISQSGENHFEVTDLSEAYDDVNYYLITEDELIKL